jgi:hypothetical protein
MGPSMLLVHRPTPKPAPSPRSSPTRPRWFDGLEPTKGDASMDGQELLAQVRALRNGPLPKAIARALGVPPATVAP